MLEGCLGGEHRDYVWLQNAIKEKGFAIDAVKKSSNKIYFDQKITLQGTTEETHYKLTLTIKDNQEFYSLNAKSSKDDYQKILDLLSITKTYINNYEVKLKNIQDQTRERFGNKETPKDKTNLSRI